MTNRFLFLSPFVLLLLLLTGCKDDDDPLPVNPEEEINSVTLTLTPTGGGDAYVLSFSDPDGDGGNAPDFNTTGTLAANSTYTGLVQFADGDEDINVEIMDEDEEHQVFYVTSSGLGATFTYDDMDEDGAPLGLVTNVATGAAGSGTVTVTLRHEPNKDPIVAIGNPGGAGGETDVEVTFDVTVQ